VPVGGLGVLVTAVREATAHIGRLEDPHPLFPHVTLARHRRARREDGPGAVLRGLAGAPVEGSWEVEEVTLVSSTLGPEGSRYEVVSVAALGGSGSPPPNSRS
jgi:2'-5' RNA ligase